MSYWAYLEKRKKPVSVDNHAEGGTFAVGGTNRAELNITWNYGGHFCDTLSEEGLRWLDGKKAKHVIKDLERAVEKLGTIRDRDYWKATRGNAGYALNILLIWAKANPGAKFRVN